MKNLSPISVLKGHGAVETRALENNSEQYKLQGRETGWGGGEGGSLQKGPAEYRQVCQKSVATT